MRKALLADVFQAAIPQFPKASGMEVINFFQSCRHPRDAVVLCRRVLNETAAEEFVVWSANMIEGGCHNGTYCSSAERAWVAFKLRIEGLN